MTNLEKLQNWVIQEKKLGLIDVKLFPVDKSCSVTLEDLSEQTLALLTSPGVDITNLNL